MAGSLEGPLGGTENGEPGPELVAYALDDRAQDVTLLAGPSRRAWMDALPDRYANRCLPLLIANQAGWLLLNPQTVWLSWDGRAGLDAVTVEYEGDVPQTRALSHFGHGIVTFHVPFLFRTTPGWNLLVRGPANCPIDGLYPLEGVVETDWSTATFTLGGSR